MDKESAQQQIIQASTRLFAEKGLHNVTTRDISKESGQNISLISYYFSGKENLYKTIIEEFALRCETRLSEVVKTFDAGKVTKESLRLALENLIEIFTSIQIEEPDAVRILVRERADGLPFSREIHEKIFATLGEQLQSIIAKGQKASIVKKKINCDFFIFSLIETLFGNFQVQQCNVRMRQKCYGLPKHKEDLKEQLLLIYFEGILS